MTQNNKIKANKKKIMKMKMKMKMKILHEIDLVNSKFMLVNSFILFTYL
jgi:hypothetical protein